MLSVNGSIPWVVFPKFIGIVESLESLFTRRAYSIVRLSDSEPAKMGHIPWIHNGFHGPHAHQTNHRVSKNPSVP